MVTRLAFSILVVAHQSPDGERAEVAMVVVVDIGVVVMVGFVAVSK
jgi:hypothetical protein